MKTSINMHQTSLIDWTARHISLAAVNDIYYAMDSARLGEGSILTWTRTEEGIDALARFDEATLLIRESNEALLALVAATES